MLQFQDKIAVIGFPDSYERYRSHASAVWTPESLARLVELGFTQVQINLAWGSRPDDEPLNLEDVIMVRDDFAIQVASALCKPGVEAFNRRRALIRERAAMAKRAGLRTLFHFGAPYNRHAYYDDSPPNCIMDHETQGRYKYLLLDFAFDFPDIDDILLYTYDQDAWLCGEFGSCPRCNGIPLHRRLPAFIEVLRKTWISCRESGRLWWEPWELSAGQIHACLPYLNPEGFGLSLHANVAESMAAVVADPWFVNTCRHASERGIPVWGEWFLGGVSEELEPLSNMAHPLTIWRGLKRLSEIPGLTGIKEYYGLMPERLYDPNLSATALFFKEPGLDGEAALTRMARFYGAAADALVQAWRLTSESMERYPWDCSWLGRQIGRARTDHALEGALLKPMLCPTPSWQSSRGTVYMRTEDTPAHPWLLEDVGLRAVQAAELGQKAVEAIERAEALADSSLLVSLKAWRADVSSYIRRALSYNYHLRATCIAIAARRRLSEGLELPEELLSELRIVLVASRDNHSEECRATARSDIWLEMDEALCDLETDPEAFLGKWLLTQWQPKPQEPFTLNADPGSRGTFSLTSR